MTLDTFLIAAGSVASALTIIWVLFDRIMKVVMLPLTHEDQRLDTKITKLSETIGHNRANADQKFEIISKQLEKIDNEMDAQAVTSAETRTALGNLKDLITTRFDDLDKRLPKTR